MNSEPVEFTDAEEKVISGITQGLTNRSIGEQLGVVEKTIKCHLTSIYKKTGCKSDREFLVWYFATTRVYPNPFATSLPSQPV